MSKIKRIAFDMDGTIADLYGSKDWLDKLINKRPVFADLEPMVDMEEVNSLCQQLETQGYEIMIITWLPKKATKDYKTSCRAEKREWLAKYFPMVKEIHAVQYGASKSSVTKGLEDCLLFDDIEEIRTKWVKFGGVAKDNTQILDTLRELLVA